MDTVPNHRSLTTTTTRRQFIKLAGATAMFARHGISDVCGGTPPALAGDLGNLFLNPGPDARPGVLWHWMNGHVTKQGITLDLEAMQRIGIGSVFNFDAGNGIPKGPVEYLSPEWLELKSHAIRESGRLGLDFIMHNCPGWSSSGGPWVTPELAMQQTTWSETHVVGGREIIIGLAAPYAKLDYYRDVAVLAFPSQPGEVFPVEELEHVTSGNGEIPRGFIAGTDETIVVRPANDGGAWLLLKLGKPFAAGSISFVSGAVDRSGGGEDSIIIEGSEDGNAFVQLAIIPASVDGLHPAALNQFHADLPLAEYHYYRIRTLLARGYTRLKISGLQHFADWRKRGNHAFNGRGLREIGDSPSGALDPAGILDLTDHLNPDGVLKWNAPPGHWTILRLGHTPTGSENHAAPDTGIGLECDKYSRRAIDHHFAKMMDQLLPVIRGLATRGRIGLEIDSWEVGMQNWTGGFEKEFERRNGYDIKSYLPALTGRLVGNPETTERFLWDFRRTQADLLAENYYGGFAELCRQNGIRSYIEPYDRGPMDEMQIGARADVNMGEFWAGLSAVFQNNRTMRRTSKLAASISHINGRKIAAAESFTGEPSSARWQEHPFALKGLGDRMFTQGVNKMVIHRFAHQPHPSAAPGMTMGPWGMHFDRTVTWWEPSRAWMKYMARCQALLQEGLFAADFAYLASEGAGLYTKVNRDELSPRPPDGYDYDVIDAQTILNQATVGNGRMILANGMSYRVLVLPQERTMTMKLLRRLHQLVLQGLVIAGDRPERPPGLANGSTEPDEYGRLVTDLWGALPAEESHDGTFGKGRVVLGGIVEALGLVPDFEVSSRSGDAPIVHIHRTVGDAEVYFLSNQRRTHEDLVGVFRVSGKTPELWNPVTGEMHVAAVFDAGGTVTRVPFSLEPYGSVFVVFRSPVKEHAGEILRSGVKIVGASPYPMPDRADHTPIVDDFSVTFWAKPEIGVMLTTDGLLEGITDYWTEYYAIYPLSGAGLHGRGHATCGVAVGRNGIAIWERVGDVPVLALAAPCKIEGWSHVAISYREGIPEVFLNGMPIAKGARKSKHVHPVVGCARLSDGASFFNGDMSEPVVHSSPLSEKDLMRLVEAGPVMPPAWNRICDAMPGAGTGFRFWRNGDYVVKMSGGRTTSLAITGIHDPVSLEGEWQVAFPPKSGAPEKITLPKLASLHTHPDAGVRYFSGTCRYFKNFVIPPVATGRGKSHFLDLGRVEVIAEVILNGRNLGVLWTRPFMIDISEALVVGTNSLEIRVTNLWVNRLIGDEQLPDPDAFAPGGGLDGWASLSCGALEKMPGWYLENRSKPDDGRVCFATWKHHAKDSPLVESGMLGPVILHTAVQAEFPR